jgi:deubiquitinase DESI2
VVKPSHPYHAPSPPLPVELVTPLVKVEKKVVFETMIKQAALLIDFPEEAEINRHKEPVVLNIYHVTTANKYLEFLGFGLYHTSVGVYGVEYSYGGHDEALPGIVVDTKGNTAGLTLKESFPIGYTYYSRSEVEQVIDRFGAFWYGVDYDPFARNCNHFTEKLISHICDDDYYYPSYVNRFTKLGSIFRMWFKPL